MKRFLISHSAIFLALLLVVYSQLVIKWQMTQAPPVPEALGDKVLFTLRMLLNPWIFSAGVATIAGGLSWMIVMSRFELGYAYLYVSLIFVFMLVAGVLLFNEPLSWTKSLGCALIVLGVIALNSGR